MTTTVHVERPMSEWPDGEWGEPTIVIRTDWNGAGYIANVLSMEGDALGELIAGLIDKSIAAIREEQDVD